MQNISEDSGLYIKSLIYLTDFKNKNSKASGMADSYDDIHNIYTYIKNMNSNINSDIISKNLDKLNQKPSSGNHLRNIKRNFL